MLTLPEGAIAPGERKRLLWSADLQARFGAWAVKCGGCSHCGDKRTGNLSGFCLAQSKFVGTWQPILCLDFKASEKD